MNISIVIILFCIIVILPFLISIIKKKKKGHTGFSCKSCKDPAICFQSQCLTNASCLIKNVQTGLYLDIAQTQDVNFLCSQLANMSSTIPTKSQCFINSINDDGSVFYIFIDYMSSDGKTEFDFVLTNTGFWNNFDPYNVGFYYKDGKIYSMINGGKLVVTQYGSDMVAIVQSPTYVGQSNDQWEIQFVPNILKK